MYAEMRDKMRAWFECADYAVAFMFVAIWTVQGWWRKQHGEKASPS